MVKLRMWRAGAKNKPFYRIVAIDSRTRRDGKYIEVLGTFNPSKNEVILQDELIYKWLNVGAKPSETVREFLSQKGIMKQFASQKRDPEAVKAAIKAPKKSKSKKAKAKAKKTKA